MQGSEERSTQKVEDFCGSLVVLGLPCCLRQGKNLPAIQETWDGSLGWDDPLENEMVTHTSIPAWRTSLT